MFVSDLIDARVICMNDGPGRVAGGDVDPVDDDDATCHLSCVLGRALSQLVCYECPEM